MGGSYFATVIVKATFGLIHGGPARLIAPQDLVRSDRHHDRSPASSLDEASELAPYLPSGGVLFRGHAYAPGGRPVPAMSVRLAIYRDRPLIEKTLHIFGDRTPQAAQNPQPFTRVPIVYERAFGGAGVEENPVGVGADPSSRALPNIVDPSNPQKPAGFGPISRYWGSRKRLLGGAERRALEAPVAEIPDGFDWRYFQAAPVDQQIELFAGGEWIVLDGLNASLPRLQAQLPAVRGLARWFASTPSGPGPLTPIDLVADTLVIDGDRQLCSLIWRGNFPLESMEAAARLRVLAGVELPGYPLVWPDPKDVPAPPPEEDGPPSRGDGSSESGSRQSVIPPSVPPPAPARSPGLLSELMTTRSPDDPAPGARPVTPFVSSPAGSGVPFVKSGAAASSSAGAGVPAAVPFVKPGVPAPPRDVEASTRMMSLDEITARGRGAAVPFVPTAGTAGAARGPTPPAAIPGAPFGSPPAAGGQGGLPQGWEKPQPPPGAIPYGSRPLPPQQVIKDEMTTTIHAKDVRAALPFVAADPGRPSPITTPAVKTGERAPKIPTGTGEFKLPVVMKADLPFGPGARLGAGIAGAPPAEPLMPAAPPRAEMAPPAMISSEIAPPGAVSPAIMPPAVMPPAMAPPAMVSSEIAPPAMGPSAMVSPPVAPPAMMAPVIASSAASSVGMAPPLVELPNAPSASPAPIPSASIEPSPVSSADIASTDTGRDVGAEGSSESAVRTTLVARLRAREAITDLALAEADLSGLDLTGARLSGVNLKGTKLVGATLTNANLGEAQLVGADLTDAILTGADLSRADLSRAVVAGTRFEGAILGETNLTAARGPGANFGRVTGRRAIFARGAWDGASFAAMDMMAADFTGAALGGADFKGATLIDARFDDATGERAVFDGAKLPQVRAQGATLTKSSFKEIDAPGSSFERATLNESSFDSAALKGASFLRATCLKTVFSGAEVGGANMQRMNGDGADLSGAKMEAVDLRQARLQDASFSEAHMQRANASKADLSKSRFTRADLSGANLRGAKLKAAVFAHAQLDAADLRDADLEQANMFSAARQTAKMSGANTKDMVETDPDAG